MTDLGTFSEPGVTLLSMQLRLSDVTGANLSACLRPNLNYAVPPNSCLNSSCYLH